MNADDSEQAEMPSVNDSAMMQSPMRGVLERSDHESVLCGMDGQRTPTLI